MNLNVNKPTLQGFVQDELLLKILGVSWGNDSGETKWEG